MSYPTFYSLSNNGSFHCFLEFAKCICGTSLPYPLPVRAVVAAKSVSHRSSASAVSTSSLYRLPTRQAQFIKTKALLGEIHLDYINTWLKLAGNPTNFQVDKYENARERITGKAAFRVKYLPFREIHGSHGQDNERTL